MLQSAAIGAEKCGERKFPFKSSTKYKIAISHFIKWLGFYFLMHRFCCRMPNLFQDPSYWQYNKLEGFPHFYTSEVYHLSEDSTSEGLWALNKDARGLCNASPLIWDILYVLYAAIEINGVLLPALTEADISNQHLKQSLLQSKWIPLFRAQRSVLVHSLSQMWRIPLMMRNVLSP